MVFVSLSPKAGDDHHYDQREKTNPTVVSEVDEAVGGGWATVALPDRVGARSFTRKQQRPSHRRREAGGWLVWTK